MSAVVNSIKSMAKEERVLGLGVEALCNLTRNDQVKPMVAKAGGIEVNRPKQLPGLQSWCLGTSSRSADLL